MDKRKRIPWVTLLLGAVAVVAQFSGSAAFNALLWRSDWILSGEVWRLVTGHFVHTSISHLVWDLGAFLILGSYLEQQGRRGLLVLLGTAALLTDIALRLGGRFELYCGLSGMDMALFARAAFDLIAKGRVSGDCFSRWLGFGALALVTGKLGFELCAGSPMFVADLQGGFLMAVEAHLAGLLAVLIAKLSSQRWDRRRR